MSRTITILNGSFGSRKRNACRGSRRRFRSEHSALRIGPSLDEDSRERHLPQRVCEEVQVAGEAAAREGEAQPTVPAHRQDGADAEARHGSAEETQDSHERSGAGQV